MAKKIEEILAKRTVQSEASLGDGNLADPANQSLDREYDAQFHLATPTEAVVLVAINLLRPFSNHPFKNYEDEKLNSLAESIKHNGLQQPIIIRAINAGSGYEILAGHNRVQAMKNLGNRDIPAIIRILDDNMAALVVVNTNLDQRDKLLPSEKAFAYKLKMEALQIGENPIIKNGDLSSDTNGFKAQSQFETERKDQMRSNSSTDSDAQIFRYIRLTALLPELLDILDQDRYPVMAGYEISFLNFDAQQAVLQYFFYSDTKDKLSLKNAVAIRTAYESKKEMTSELIHSAIHKPPKKRGPITYSFSHKELLKSYALPDDFDLTAFVHEKLKEAFCCE